jgi:hypothetical protein
MEKTGVPGENQRPVAKECVIYFYALLCKRNAVMSQCCIMIKYNYMVFKYLHGAEVDKRV